MSMGLLMSEVCLSYSCIAEASMFQRQLLILVVPLIPSHAQGWRLLCLPGDADVSGGCLELPAHVLEGTHSGAGLSGE